jgi:signal transduction histidine kinase
MERQGIRAEAEALHELQVHQIELEMQNEELRRSQLELQAAHERYVDLYDFAPVGYLTLDESGVISAANLTAATFLGTDRGVLVGRPFGAFVAAGDADRWQVFSSTTVREGGRHACRLEVRKRSGTTFDSQLECECRTGETGNAQLRVALSDVSEFVRLEHALGDTQARLAVASRLAAMGTLVAGVAHEINNPLSAELSGQGFALEVIRSVQEKLGGSSPSDLQAVLRDLALAAEALEDAQEGGLRISRIVKDLSTFGRSGATKTALRLADVVEKAMRWLPEKVSRVATLAVENMGPPDVMASAGQIQEIVLNLVSNAAKATPEGKHGTIFLRIGPGEPGMARLEVTDHGVGIDPAILDQVFDPFFTTRNVGEGRGTGLGLAICHVIATSHGGSLTVTSELGKGSTFRLELPALAPGG